MGRLKMQWVVALLAVSVAACNASASLTSPSPSATLNLGISNGTTLTVTLVVNGQRVADFPPGGPAPTIDPSALPALPWNVEARSPSGRVLTSMHVEPGQVWSTTDPNGAVEHQGTIGRVDLSCGRLTIWAADFLPSGPAPAESPGPPGDCAP